MRSQQCIRGVTGAVVAIVLGAIAAVTFLSAIKADTQAVLTLIAPVVVPTVTILLVGSRVESKVDNVGNMVEQQGHDYNSDHGSSGTHGRGHG